jgi:nucleotide-binding universal stress UspA family protein
MRGPRGKRHGAPRPGPGKAGPAEPPPGGGPVTAAVVVGLDGSDTSWDAFWWACGEARRLCGQLVAVFVSSSTEASMVAMASSAAGVAVYDSEAVEQATSARAWRLRAEVAGLSDGLEVTFVHTRGDPARELLRVAGDIRADMIVVGRSAKARHQIAGSLGHCLVTRRRSPIVVIVP